MFIIRNTDWFSCENWSMEINPEGIASTAGVIRTEKIPGGTYRYVDYPLPTAKKLMKMILQYADEDAITQCDEAFVRNKKLFKIWMDLKTKTLPQG